MIESVALGEKLVVKTKMPAGKDCVQSVEFLVRQVDVAEDPFSDRVSEASGIGAWRATDSMPDAQQSK